MAKIKDLPLEKKEEKSQICIHTFKIRKN